MCLGWSRKIFILLQSLGLGVKCGYWKQPAFNPKINPNLFPFSSVILNSNMIFCLKKQAFFTHTVDQRALQLLVQELDACHLTVVTMATTTAPISSRPLDENRGDNGCRYLFSTLSWVLGRELFRGWSGRICQHHEGRGWGTRWCWGGLDKIFNKWKPIFCLEEKKMVKGEEWKVVKNIEWQK